MKRIKDFYVSETAKYNDQVNAYLAMFPVDVKEEDAILLGKRMEDKLGDICCRYGFLGYAAGCFPGRFCFVRQFGCSADII